MAEVLPYVVLQTSNDSHAHRIYTTLAASESRGLYACFTGRLECERVLRPYPDTMLLCGVRGTEAEFLELLTSTHIGAKVFRVYFCTEAPTADAAAVAAWYGEQADKLVCRMQCCKYTSNPTKLDFPALFPRDCRGHRSAERRDGDGKEYPDERRSPHVGFLGGWLGVQAPR